MIFRQIDLSNYVILDTLHLGDCFLYDGRVGMVASRNGHDFYLDLASGHEFWISKIERSHTTGSTHVTIPNEALVQRVKGEFVFEII